MLSSRALFSWWVRAKNSISNSIRKDSFTQNYLHSPSLCCHCTIIVILKGVIKWIFLKGEWSAFASWPGRIYLKIRHWINDPEIRGLTGSVTPMGEPGDEKFFEKVYSSEDRVWFSVWSLEDNRMIGEAGLLRMFPAWRRMLGIRAMALR